MSSRFAEATSHDSDTHQQLLPRTSVLQIRKLDAVEDCQCSKNGVGILVSAR